MKVPWLPMLSVMAATIGSSSAQTFHDLSATDIDGKTVNFSSLRGSVVMITNVASA